MKKFLIAALWSAIFPIAQAHGSGAERLHFFNDCSGTLICSSTGFKAKHGYQFTPRFTAEMVHIDFRKASTSLFMKLPFDSRGSSVGLHVLSTLALAPAWAGFGRVGMSTGLVMPGWEGTAIGSRADRGNAAWIGMGIHYAIQDNVFLRGGIERYWLDAIDDRYNVTNVAVGMKYRF